MTVCHTPQAQAASFSRHYINLQVNTALYLLWSPWTHLKTCGSLPLLHAPPPPHLPSSSRTLPRAQSTPSTQPRCHYFPPSSSLLIMPSSLPIRVFFFLNSPFKMFHNPALQEDNTEIFMRCCEQEKVQTQQYAAIIT